MAKIYYDRDCDLKLLEGKVIGRRCFRLEGCSERWL